MDLDIEAALAPLMGARASLPKVAIGDIDSRRKNIDGHAETHFWITADSHRCDYEGLLHYYLRWSFAPLPLDH